jgi:hypothetical protein
VSGISKHHNSERKVAHADWLSAFLRSAKRVGVDQGWAASLSCGDEYSLTCERKGVGARSDIGCKPRCVIYLGLWSRMRDIVGQTKQGMVKN